MLDPYKKCFPSKKKSDINDFKTTPASTKIVFAWGKNTFMATRDCWNNCPAETLTLRKTDLNPEHFTQV